MKLSLALSPLLLLISMASTQAAVIYSGVQNIPVPFTFPSGTYLNVVTGLSLQQAADPVDFDTAPWISLDLGGDDIYNGALLLPVVVSPNRVLNLAPATSVDSSSNFVAGGSASSSIHIGAGADQFQQNTPGYIGFAFKATPVSATQYGWAKITVNTTGIGTGTIHEWAYESVAGTAIPVGFTGIPEPSLLSLCALSILFSFRRGRK